MKTFIKTILTISITVCLFACKNSYGPVPVSGAINITNAVIGGSTLTLSVNGNAVSSGSVSLNNYASLPVIGGQTQLSLGATAIAATLTAPTVPAITYYTNTITVNSASNYSLFLTGSSPSSVDNVLISENYTTTYPDSVCGVRFINLAPGSNPISVDIKGNANGSEVSSLAYKAYGNFIQHPALKTNTSYVFEFRDATSGVLLTSYTMTTPYFHNVTLCFRGVTGAYGVILDKDYY